ncbi:MAG TPA: hypothetical protein VN456_01180 [Desulfosporosinus sp.]|nr:hypothetical protein [Desulfosporosinus sp.]
MSKLNNWKLVIPIIIFTVLLVISASDCSSNPSLNSSFKIAAPFKLISGKLLLETSNFPVYLPSYLPPPYQENKWHLNLETSKNKFTIEIDQWTPDQRTGTGRYAGTLSGNIENPLGPPIVEQFINENKEVKTITLPNGIEGKEYIMDLDAFRTISWKIGYWSYFVAARPGQQEGSTRNYASEIIKTIGVDGLALSDFPGKLYFLYIGANHPTAEIYWKVNDSVWYQLIWRDDPSNAIKILRSMNYLGVGQAKNRIKADSDSWPLNRA